MKNQAYRMTMLFDFFGDMLTERQKEVYDLYYNEDLSLSEISENLGISRQGVRDLIVRSERSLSELEEKTGIIKRFEAMRVHAEKLEQVASWVEKTGLDESGEVAEWARAAAAALKE